MRSSVTGQDDGQSTDFHRQLRAFRRHWVLIVLTFLSVTGAALALSVSQEKKYTAAASLLFRESRVDQTLFGSQIISRPVDPDREAATNVKLVSLDAISRRTAAALREPPLADRARRELGGRPPLTEGQIAASTNVSAEGQSDIVSVEYTDPSPRVAALVANTFAAQYIEFRRQADRAKIAEALQLVQNELGALRPRERGGPEGRSLRQRSDQLEILQSLQTGNAEIVEGARIPAAASSPRPVRDGILGAFLGLILGVGLAILVTRLDRRLRDPSEIEEIIQRPILGIVPLVRGRKDKLPPAAIESYRLLRASLRYFNVNRDVRSVLVTSAAPGDGKTTVAWYLASVAAESGGHVLLIETDLRRPTLAQRFDVATAPGLTTLLATNANFEDVVQHVPVTTSKAAASSGRTLDVISAGPLPPNPSDMVESDRLRELLEFAESRYDLVVIDTPPTSVVSDAIPLTKQVSGVIVVARLGQSTVESVTHLARQLSNLGAPVLGAVVNALRDAKRYGYGYGYGYDDRYAAAADNDEFQEIVGAARDEGGTADAASAPMNAVTGDRDKPRSRSLLRRRSAE